MRSAQLAGLLLWRFGLLLAGGWTTFEGIRLALRHIELPHLVETGVGLILTGIVFVFVSLILERRADAKAEGDLSS